MKLRVLHVVAGYPTPERPHNQMFIKTQVDSLIAAGIECDVLVLHGSGFRKYLTGHAQVRHRLRAGRFDLLHAHYSYCAPACLGHGVPLVTSLLGSDLVGLPDAAGRYSPLSKASHRALARFVISRSAAGIVKSRQMAEVLGKPVHVVPNGVDLDHFHPLGAQERVALRRDLGFEPATRYVLFAGDPGVPRKRFGLARDAVALCSARMPFPVQLLPLCGRSHDDVVRHMQACDALLLTSTWEGSPNVVKEAMATDMAVVSVEVGDTRERLEGVPGCRVTDRDDAESLAVALADVLTSDEPRECRAAVEALRLEVVAARVLAIYEDAISRRRPAQRPGSAAGTRR